MSGNKRSGFSKATEKELREELEIHAAALGLPEGAAKAFIKETLSGAKKTLSDTSIITRADLRRAVAHELKKYNADFAYIYRNYDIII